ncbi:hypothetical protein SteCoe_23316 [Stentor coeruleus]|uniref:Uncharacterized protein n=1 Tax=Stentor coeruleus TaxID=5963 RepID=A0A1R2BK69_9CILI|nr:hypothetical protein SteCoe_23316 [Stentor coeruleus]
MNLQTQSRTQCLQMLINHSPRSKQKVAEIFEFISKNSNNNASKTYFIGLANTIKNDDPNKNQIESIFASLDKLPMNFKVYADINKPYISGKFLYFKDETESVLCKYALLDDNIEASLMSSNNKFSDSIIISYNNNKCFIQQKPIDKNQVFVSVLVSNPPIYDGNLFLFGNTSISCTFKKGKYVIKYYINGTCYHKNLENNGFNYEIAPGFNVCSDKIGSAIMIGGSIVKENKKWIIRPQNGEKVIRALHTNETYKAKEPSYPLAVYDGMEIFFAGKKYKVSINLE